MAGEFFIEEPHEWRDDPANLSMVYRVYVPAQDPAQARQVYLEYRDGSDEHAINMLRAGRVCGTVEQADDFVILAQMQGRQLTVFRVLGGLE